MNEVLTELMTWWLYSDEGDCPPTGSKEKNIRKQ